MNIIIITCVLPWRLNSGGAQAQFNMIDHLRKKHNITIIFPEDSQNKMVYAKELQQIWPDVKLRPYRIWKQMLYPRFLKDKAERALKLAFTPESERFKVQRALKHYGIYPSNGFMHFVNNIIKEEHADIVQVEFYPCLWLVRGLPDNVRKIFIHHELRYIKNERTIMAYHPTEKELKWMYELKQEELDDLNRYDTVVTLTQQDKDYLQRDGVCKPIYVSPAAINTEISPFCPWNHRLAFVGSFLHQPNVEGIDWYMNEVLPLLQKAPLLEIIGKGWPTKYKTKDINTLGFVDDLHEVTSGSIMIVPILSGSGMRMKILEAAAMSMPIITTTVGVEGLNFKHGDSCIIADSPQEFASAIKQLSENEDICRKLGEQANKVFRENYSKDILAEVRNKVYSL